MGLRLSLYQLPARTPWRPLSGARIAMSYGFARRVGCILPSEHVGLRGVLQVDIPGLGPLVVDVLKARSRGALGEAELVPGGFALGSVKEPSVP